MLSMGAANMTQSTIPSDVRERIIAAAEDLYVQSGRERVPTVDAVRRSSRADMNAVSTVMKEWRQAQTAKATPVAVAVPEPVQQASAVALATLWQQAVDLSNQSLRNAQAAWEVERQELDDMRAELAAGYEIQATELDTIKQQLTASEEKEKDQAQELATVRQREAAALSRADKAEARITEIERRAADLRTELDLAHNEVERQRAQSATDLDAAKVAIDALRNELSGVKRQAAADLEAANKAIESGCAELVKAQTKAEADAAAHANQHKLAKADAERLAESLSKAEGEREEAKQVAAEARERAAGLAGQLDVLKEQNSTLLAAIKSGDVAGQGKK
jgi:chromosome segregation ATPase